MAHKVACPKIIRSLRSFAKPHYSAAHSSITAVSPLHLDHILPPPPTKTTTNLRDGAPSRSAILNLDDVKELFSSVSTPKLVRSAINLHATAFEPMVDLGTWVMNSKLMHTPLLREVTVGTIKHTFYGHFCAGSGPAEAAQTAAKIWDSGLKGMLVYALEHASDNESCDRNLEGFLQTVESAKLLPTSSVSFVVVKITAICPLGLLKRVSDLLRWEYNNESFQLPWKLNSLPIFADSSPFYHTPRKPDPLTPEEETDLHLAQQRLLKICQNCIEANVPLTIDAEDTSVQPGIDYFTYSAALMYNVGDNPIIYGTIQTYLKDAKERLIKSANSAEKMGVPMGFKLVRELTCRAKDNWLLPLVLNPQFTVPLIKHMLVSMTAPLSCLRRLPVALDQWYSRLTTWIQLCWVIGNKAAAKARDLGIRKGNKKLQFAQLYGMADGLSFGLKNAGFQVSKYMPFGPVELVMPYLLRRAEENRGLLSTSTFDRYLMRKELMRRLKAAIM